MNSKSTHKLTIAVVCLLCLAFFSCSVFADTFNSGWGSAFMQYATYSDGSNGIRYDVLTSALNAHLIDISVDTVTSTTNPSYTITPVTSSGARDTSINITHGSAHIDNPNTHTTGSFLYWNQNTSTVELPYGFTMTPSSTTNSSTTHKYYAVQQDFIIYVSALNLSSTDVVQSSNSYISLDPSITFYGDKPAYLGYTIELLSNDGLTFMRGDNQRYLFFCGDSEHSANYRITIGKNEKISCTYKLSVFGLYTDTYNTQSAWINSVVFGNASSCEVSNAPDPSMINELYNLNNTLGLTYNDLHELKNAYISANSTYDDNMGEEVKSDAESKTATIESIHESETQYYNQNRQAIEDTGLTNFNYSPEQISSFSVLITDFNNLWNALDGWTFVYSFSLMLSLALLIIRHKPMTRDKGGGSKDA